MYKAQQFDGAGGGSRASVTKFDDDATPGEKASATERVKRQSTTDVKASTTKVDDDATTGEKASTTKIDDRLAGKPARRKSTTK